MREHLNARVTGLLAIALLTAAMTPVLGATATLDFDGPEWGTPDNNCLNNPQPPLFNRPEYGAAGAAYLVDPADCGKGALNVDDGSDSLLTAFFSSTPSNSNELRFSWVDPADDRSWARILTSTQQSVTPKRMAPTVHVGIGSKIRMDVMCYGTTGTTAGDDAVTTGGLEFSLAIRETGKNLPLGVDGGGDGLVEVIGADSRGSGTDTATPIGGMYVTPSDVFTTLEWEFVDAGGGVIAVQCRANGVDQGAPKPVLAWTGNGVLDPANMRGTLDSLMIRKPVADDTTKKWFVNIDTLVIEAPGITDPVQIAGPLNVFQSSVTVNNIAPDATDVKLYSNGVLVATATTPPEDFSDFSHTFTGLTLSVGNDITATQVVAGIESAPSSALRVSDKVCLEDFANGVTWTKAPAAGGGNFRDWYEVNSMTYATASQGTLDSSLALRIYDGGFMNGVYAIYQAAIPSTGTYMLSSKMWVHEDAGASGALRRYQMGVVVNGVHRDVTSASSPGSNTLACHNQSLKAVDLTLPGNAVGNYVGLTNGDDSGLAPQMVTTGEFTANAGDNILVVFSTNVDTPWKNVALASGRLDTLDPCETPTGFPPVPHPVPNEQGTWNITAGRSNTAAGLGGGFYVLVDDICLIRPEPCKTVAAVTVAGPLVTGATSVTVTGVDLAATEVKVYANGTAPAIGSAPGNGTATVVVPVNPLVANQTISATQTLGGQEGCIANVGPKVGDCAQIVPVSVVGPVNQGATTVTVGGVDAAATAVKVYDGATLIGQLTGGIVAGNNVVTVSPALTKGHTIVATQTIATLEGCVPGAGQVVGSGGNAAIRLSIGIRETGTSGPVGADGGGTGSIEWLIPDDPADPADGVVTDGAPMGKLITPSYEWQTVTFNPTTDKIVGFNLGDGSFGGAAFGVMESLAVTSAGADTGPYMLYIDNITSGGTTFQSFEAPLVDGNMAIFQAPSYSATSTPHLATPPNSSTVKAGVNDAAFGPANGTQAELIQWRYKDEAANRFIRVATLATPNMPNPAVDLTQPITMRVLLRPAFVCNTPWADADNDDDVDAADFGVLQRCINTGPHGPGHGITQAACACLDLPPGLGVINADEIAAFAACATGPGVPFPATPPAGCTP